MKKQQNAQEKPGGEAQKTEQGRTLVLKHLGWMSFSRERLFEIMENRASLGSGLGTGSGCAPGHVEREPGPLGGSAAVAQPRGSRQRIVSFQSENLQALGNDIQKSI